jgi:hypothetical protein
MELQKMNSESLLMILFCVHLHPIYSL